MVSATNANTSIGSVPNRQPIFNSSTNKKIPSNKLFSKAFAGVGSIGKDIFRNIKKTGAYTLGILKAFFKQTRSVNNNPPVTQNLSKKQPQQEVNLSTQEKHPKPSNNSNEKSFKALSGFVA